MRLSVPSFVVSLVLIGLICGCGEEEDPFALSIAISGTVTNESGVSGDIIVEIDYNKRDVADDGGHYSIAISKDFFIDSLYAWVDSDGNNRYSAGEPHGFYHSPTDPDHAKTIHARKTNITNVNFSIP